MSAPLVFPGDPARGGWRKMLLSWEWHDLWPHGYPGWERSADRERNPHFVKVRVVNGAGPSTQAMASQFDDVTEGAFYYRDVADSGLPFVSEGVAYHGLFWFQTKAEAERFRLMWYPYVVSTNYGAACLTPEGRGVEFPQDAQC